MKLKIFRKIPYEWVIIGACFSLNTIIFGIRNSFGIFFKSFETEFNLSRGATSSIYAALMLLCCIFIVVGGWIQDKFGPRIMVLIMGLTVILGFALTSQSKALWQIYFFYSLLLAIGTAAVYPVSVSVISHWFPQKRGNATGISTSGVGFGTLIAPQIIAPMISFWNWRISCLVIGFVGGIALILLSRILYKDPYSNKGNHSQNHTFQSIENKIPKPRNSILSYFKSINIWIFSLNFLCGSICFNMMITHTVPYTIDRGILITQGALILGLIGASATLGRLLSGKLADLISCKMLIIGAILLQVAALFWLIQANNIGAFYIFSVAFGLGSGMIDVPIFMVIGETYGIQNMGVLVGILGIGWNIGAAIGPELGGLIYDSQNDYTLAFVAGALIMILAAICSVFINERNKNQSHQPI